MHLPVGDAGTGHLEGQLIAVIDNLVHLPLLGGEFAGGRVGAGEVAGVVLVTLHAGINDHQLAGLNNLVMNMVVQGFPVLGKDGGEGHAPAFGQRHAFHFTHNVLFDDTRDDGIPRHGVHLIAQGARGVNGLNLNVFLDKAQGNDGLDKGFRGFSARHQLLQLEGVVVAGRRQEVKGAAGCQGLGYSSLQGAVRLRLGYAHGVCLAANGRLRSHPDNIVNVHIVRK